MFLIFLGLLTLAVFAFTARLLIEYRRLRDCYKDMFNEILQFRDKCIEAGIGISVPELRLKSLKDIFFKGRRKNNADNADWKHIYLYRKKKENPAGDFIRLLPFGYVICA